MAPVRFVDTTLRDGQMSLWATGMNTAIPPLADGSSNPSVVNVAANARALGYDTVTDEEAIKPVAKHFTAVGFIKKRPDVVKRYLQAYIEALKFISSNPATTKKVIAKYANTNSQDDLDESHRALAVAWEQVPYMSPAAIQTLIDFSQHPTAKSAKPTQFIDNSFVAELEHTGFTDQVWR